MVPRVANRDRTVLIACITLGIFGAISLVAIVLRSVHPSEQRREQAFDLLEAGARGHPFRSEDWQVIADGGAGCDGGFSLEFDTACYHLLDRAPGTVTAGMATNPTAVAMVIAHAGQADLGDNETSPVAVRARFAGMDPATRSADTAIGDWSWFNQHAVTATTRIHP